VIRGAIAALAVVWSALPARAAAPELASRAPQPYVHDGLYLRAAAGVGLFGATAAGGSPGGSGERRFGGEALALELGVGGSPSPGMVFGGGFLMDPVFGLEGQREDGSAIDLDSTRFRLAAIGPLLDFYPMPERGLHFQLLLAYAELAVSPGDPLPQDVEQDAEGIAISFGGGWEWWLGPEWSAGALARVAWAPLEVDANGAAQPGTATGSVQVEIVTPALLLTVTHH
jgi:hypothetical protein